MAGYGSYFNSSCTEVGPQCPIEGSVYGYRPSLGLNLACMTSFCILGIAHACIGFWKKTHFFTYLVTIGCIFEIVGYAGRIHLWEFPFSGSGFLMDMTCLNFATVFFAAALHLTLRHVTLAFGASTCILSPTTCSWIFAMVDTACLVLNIIGGALIGTAQSRTVQMVLGAHMILVSIALQMLTVVVCSALMTDYLVRTRQSWHGEPFAPTRLLGTSKFKVFVAAMFVAYATISTRCLYRVAELMGGFPSTIMRHQVSFAVLESGVMIVAVMALIAFHAALISPEPTCPRPISRLRSLIFHEPARSQSHGELEMVCQGVVGQPELLKETFENGIDEAKKSRSRGNTIASIGSADGHFSTRPISKERLYAELNGQRPRADTEASFGTAMVMRSPSRQASIESWHSEATVVDAYDLDTRVLTGREQIATTVSPPERLDSSHPSHEIGNAQ